MLKKANSFSATRRIRKVFIIAIIAIVVAEIAIVAAGLAATMNGHWVDVALLGLLAMAAPVIGRKMFIDYRFRVRRRATGYF